MLCPNCGNLFADGRICPKCNMDAVLYKKAKTASLKFYNLGLARAKEGNITGAIINLEKCLNFDKTNIDARDLLGLCYFKKGEVADALKHWIISSSRNSKKSRAKDYIDVLNRNTRMLDKYNDAVRQYNRAMEYMSQGSTDLAVIQLKKALDYNPEFVKALCLYALCLIEEKDYQTAMDCVQRAIEIDNGCDLALRYKNEIMSIPGFRTGKRTEEKKAEPIKVRRNTLGGFDILLALGGAVITAVILITLVFPAWTDGKSEDIKRLEAQVATLTEENENGTSVFAVKYTELQKENEALRAENDKLKYDELHREAILAIREAEILGEQGKMLDAGKILAGLEYEKFDETLKAQFDGVSVNIYPQAAIAACNDGAVLFTTGDYSAAKELFEFSYKVGPEGEKADDCLYYLGRIAQADDDAVLAKEYYETLINAFPQSNFSGEAKNLIVNL